MPIKVQIGGCCEDLNEDKQPKCVSLGGEITVPEVHEHVTVKDLCARLQALAEGLPQRVALSRLTVVFGEKKAHDRVHILAHKPWQWAALVRTIARGHWRMVPPSYFPSSEFTGRALNLGMGGTGTVVIACSCRDDPRGGEA